VAPRSYSLSNVSCPIVSTAFHYGHHGPATDLCPRSVPHWPDPKEKVSLRGGSRLEGHFKVNCCLRYYGRVHNVFLLLCREAVWWHVGFFMTVTMDLTLSGRGVQRAHSTRGGDMGARCHRYPYFDGKFGKKRKRSAAFEEAWCLLSGHSVLKMLVLGRTRPSIGGA
jgi:hypothetical protein